MLTTKVETQIDLVTEYCSGIISGSGSDGEDSDPVLGKTLSEILDGKQLVSRRPRLRKGSTFVYRYDTGWFSGAIIHAFTSAERKTLDSDDLECNVEVK